MEGGGKRGWEGGRKGGEAGMKGGMKGGGKKIKEVRTEAFTVE